MQKPRSMKALEELGRVRLSPNFFLRDFLHSEIASFCGMSNIPDDTIGWSETSWHTFMKGEGVELDIDGRRMILSCHASEAEAIENSGINMTQHDESRTPYNYEAILTRLSRYCTMTCIKATRIHR